MRRERVSMSTEVTTRQGYTYLVANRKRCGNIGLPSSFRKDMRARRAHVGNRQFPHLLTIIAVTSHIPITVAVTEPNYLAQSCSGRYVTALSSHLNSKSREVPAAFFL
jgi:hypothetical protein